MSILNPINKGKDGYYHPRTDEDVSGLIRKAIRDNLKVRVRGSAHSVNAAIYTSNFETPPINDPNINIYLDQMIAVRFDNATMQVSVEAGCHLGYDPQDPTHTSSAANSLFFQLDQKGWALSITGGITYQTVAGFVSTGSTGGSLHHTIDRQIVALRIVDGQGDIRELHKTDNLDDEFYASVVSMGLLGVVTAITFQCEPRYDIRGTEIVCAYDNPYFSALEADPKSANVTLADFLRSQEYTRIMWWGQPGVRKLVVWQAQRLSPGTQRVTPKPYHVLPVVFGSNQLFQEVFAALLTTSGTIACPPSESPLARVWRSFLSALYPLFNTLSLYANDGLDNRQNFQDTWWKGLPADDHLDYKLLVTNFHELWIPFEHANAAWKTIQEHFDRHGFAATGTYPIEIKPTPRSDFWLSPAYQRDVIKFDTLWFAKSQCDPNQVHFPQFWPLLKPYQFRLHWGKALPSDLPTLNYLKQQYPRWNDFLEVRTKRDPHDVFLTDYWRQHFAL